jgi:xylulokinase
MSALGLEPAEVRLVGGGSKNRLWRQIVADVFQLPIRLPLEPESAAFGAALQAAAVHQGVAVADFVQQHQAMAEEVVRPDPAAAAAYAAAFQRHVERGEVLFGGGSG